MMTSSESWTFHFRDAVLISFLPSFHFHSDLLASFHCISRAHFLPALLNPHRVQAVLSAHDTVAQKNFDPVLPPLPEDLDDDFEEESVKIVRLVKNKEPLVKKIYDKNHVFFFTPLHSIHFFHFSLKLKPSNQSKRQEPTSQNHCNHVKVVVAWQIWDVFTLVLSSNPVKQWLNNRSQIRTQTKLFFLTLWKQLDLYCHVIARNLSTCSLCLLH